MKQEQVIELAAKAWFATGATAGLTGMVPWIGLRAGCEGQNIWHELRFFASLVEQATLERAAKACEAMHPEDGPHAYAWMVRNLTKEST